MDLMRACVEAALSAIANEKVDLGSGNYRVLWDASDVGTQVSRHMDSARPARVCIRMPSTFKLHLNHDRSARPDVATSPSHF